MNDSVPQEIGSREDRRENRRDLLILLLILLFGFACLLATAQIAAQPIDPWRIDVGMRSEFNPDEDYTVDAVPVEPIIPEVMTIPAWAPGGEPVSNRGDATVIPPLDFGQADTPTPAGSESRATATPAPRSTQPSQTRDPSTTPTPEQTTSATPTLPPTTSATPTLPPTSSATPFPTEVTVPTNTPIPPPTSTPRPTNTPIPPPTSTPLPTNTPEPTHVPPGQTRTPPGLTHAPPQISNSWSEGELSNEENTDRLPLSLLIGSVGLFFTAQATAWRIQLRPKRQR